MRSHQRQQLRTVNASIPALIVMIGGLWSALGATSVELARADSALEDTWTAAYSDEAKIGYFHTLVDRVDAGGQTVFYTHQESRLQVKRFQDVLTLAEETDTYEMPSGRVYAVDSVLTMAGSKTIISGRLGEDGEFLLSLTTQGKTTTQKLAWPIDVIGPAAQRRSLREKPLRAGEKRIFRQFLPGFNLIARQELEATSMQEIALRGGKKTTLLPVNQTLTIGEGSSMVTLPKGILYLDGQGKTQRETLELQPGLVLNTYRVTKAEALEASTDGADLGYQTLLTVNKKFSDIHAQNQLTYAITFTDPKVKAAFPQANYQKVNLVSDNEIHLTVSATRPTKNPSSEKADAEFLEPNGFVQSDDPAIIRAAQDATKEAVSSWDKAVTLEKWVRGYMTNRDFTVGFDSAASVLASRQGDCTEHAVLLCALCRAVQIPARVAMGLVYLNGTDQMGYHMWTEVFVDGTWFPIDATLARGGIGAGHIKIADGSLKGASAMGALLPIFQVIGKVKIRVLEK